MAVGGAVLFLLLQLWCGGVDGASIDICNAFFWLWDNEDFGWYTSPFTCHR